MGHNLKFPQIGDLAPPMLKCNNLNLLSDFVKKLYKILVENQDKIEKNANGVATLHKFFFCQILI